MNQKYHCFLLPLHGELSFIILEFQEDESPHTLSTIFLLSHYYSLVCVSRHKTQRLTAKLVPKLSLVYNYNLDNLMQQDKQLHVDSFSQTAHFHPELSVFPTSFPSAYIFFNKLPCSSD